MTADERREYMKNYRAEHKARQKANHKKWQEKNREKVNAYHREYYRKKRTEKHCTSSDDCTACEYCYHDNGYNECAVDGVKPPERSKQ